uniref:Uncharacterized protein n=1 Tax=Tanacetum cinerariifolium TaxID=118510 RepID=A0A6L2M8Y4_TANCI|nr:hypothetical protein [Tanacetum cinerariifolium]
MKAQTFKERIIQNMNSIEQCIVERASREQELQNGLKMLNERNRSRNECNDKSTSRDDTDIRPSYDTEPIVETDHNVVECDDECVAPANLIAILKLDVHENKKSQKQLKKKNASLTQILKECKSTLAETSRTLGESNIDYDKIEHKLKETLGLLAQKEIDIKEGLKLKAYEILVIKEKHDELFKQSLLTKPHYEALVKEKTETQNDSFAFVHELKQEIHDDLKYAESLKNEIDELESDKAEFSNMYDILLQECKDYAKNRQKSVKTGQYQTQDWKSTLKAESKGVSHDLTKPVTSHSWPLVRKSSFAKPYDVNAPGPSRKSPKHVSFQSLRESVGSNDMVHNYYLEEAKKKAQLQKDKALNTKPSVQQSAR